MSRKVEFVVVGEKISDMIFPNLIYIYSEFKSGQEVLFLHFIFKSIRSYLVTLFSFIAAWDVSDKVSGLST